MSPGAGEAPLEEKQLTLGDVIMTLFIGVTAMFSFVILTLIILEIV